LFATDVAFLGPIAWIPLPATPKIELLPPFYNHSLFIEAYATRIQETLRTLPKETPFISFFTAHSIPIAMAETSEYVAQLETSASMIAKKLGLRDWRIAYQSRSGNPRVPWLEPDIAEALNTVPKEGKKAALVVPAGFLCDHVEVLYDLDIEAKAAADKLGIGFYRVRTVETHPTFIRMLTQQVLDSKTTQEAGV